jgi:hypothetical protein
MDLQVDEHTWTCDRITHGHEDTHMHYRKFQPDSMDSFMTSSGVDCNSSGVHLSRTAMTCAFVKNLTHEANFA